MMEGMAMGMQHKGEVKKRTVLQVPDVKYVAHYMPITIPVPMPTITTEEANKKQKASKTSAVKLNKNSSMAQVLNMAQAMKKGRTSGRLSIAEVTKVAELMAERLAEEEEALADRQAPEAAAPADNPYTVSTRYRNSRKSGHAVKRGNGKY